MKRKQYQTLRILADELKISNDSWKTGLNNNDLIIGVSGAGKTRGYVEPNLLANKGSIVVTDTKGNLCGKYRKALENRGFQVKQLDFTDCEGSVGYNPLDYIHYDEKRGKYKELDIMRVAAAIIPDTDTREPFWYIAARAYIEFAIAFVLEVFPKEMHTMEWVNKLIGAASASSPEKKLTDEGEQQASEFREELIKWTEDTSVEPGEWLAESVRKCQNALQPWQLSEIMDDLKREKPDSLAVKKYYTQVVTFGAADKTRDSVLAIVSSYMSRLALEEALALYHDPEKLDFRRLGREKTAVFLTVSDTDRSQDLLVNLFYTQLLQELCLSADKDYRDHCLPIPVRIILDDFATNACIPDFDNTISVIRSREIYVSIILQSLSQLDAMYGEAKASTIINNCDCCLYLGGQDVRTAEVIGMKANLPASAILQMPRDEAYLFVRGENPKKVRRFDLQSVENDHEGREVAG